MQDVLRPQLSANDADSPRKCVPGESQTCLFIYSEINFYYDTTNNSRGLGGYLQSRVEGMNAGDYYSTVKDYKETFIASDGSITVTTTTQNRVQGGPAQLGFSYSNPSRGTYKIEAHHQFEYHGYVITQIPNIYIPSYPAPPAARKIQWRDLYDRYETPVDFGLQVSATQELNKPGHHLVMKNCTSPVSVQTVFTPTLPDGNTAPPVTWTGGTPASDNLHRLVPCTSPGDVKVRAAVGSNLYADVTVHVVDADPPGPTNQANITQTYLGYTDPGVSDFGVFISGIDANGDPTSPSYFPSVTAGLDGDHWVFRLGSVVDGYKTGVHAQGRTDLPRGDQRPFPIADLLVAAEGSVTVVRAHTAARADLDTSGVVPNTAVIGPPPLQYYYVANVIQAHEQKHVEHFYLPGLVGGGWYYQAMLSFEKDIVEAPISFLNYSCEPSIRTGESTPGGAKSVRKLSTWDDALTSLYHGAQAADGTDTEDYAYRATNPQFELIRNQIPTGGAPQLDETTMSQRTATPGTSGIIDIDGTNLDAHPVASLVPNDPKVSVFYDSGTPTHIKLRFLVAPDAQIGARTIKVETDNGFSTVTLTIVSTP